MAVDLVITIQNYVATDRYTINIYRDAASVVPIVSNPIDRNAGQTHYFRNMASGFNYEAEVIHHCPNGANIKKRIIISQPQSPVCNCTNGYTANADDTRCVKVTTVDPIVTTAYGVGAGPNEAAYCREGIRVYNGSYGPDGRGAVDWASGAANSYWASLNGTANGRLNIAGIWNSAHTSNPVGVWIGFSKTINVVSSKIYYVAIAGDNFCRIKVNGIVIVDQQKNTVDPLNVNFNYWHCYPLFLNAGVNIIEMEGYNSGMIGCFAAEIYSCTLDELKTVTIGTESILNRIFSTGDESAFSSYGCQTGYALDLSSTPVCRKIEYQECG
jgi:hypothetical protein